MSKRRLAGSAVALVVAALIGGTLINVVAAAPMEAVRHAEAARRRRPSPGSSVPPRAAGEPGRTASRSARRFATNLSVSQDELVAASKAAIATAVDQAIADGTLTQAAADRLKARIAAAEAEGCGFLSDRVARSRPRRWPWPRTA